MASSPANRAYVNNGVPPSQAKQAKVYQIDFTAVASGKRIASSKRRVRWRFGFANPQALANGETGTACRGEEHDVTLVWSITSGKRLVLADGQEVHYSSSRNSIFDFSWTMRGNHVLKIVAHAAPPLSVQPGFRQYDFFVDGQSFFTFPKVFRLGLAPGAAASVASPPISPTHLAERGERRSSSNSGTSTNIANLESPNNPDEEEAYLQEAIRQSLQDDDDKKPAAKTTATSNDLLDFGSTPSLPAPLPALVAATSVAAYGSSYGGAGGGGGGGPDPFAYSSTPSFPTHIPSTTTAPPNPYAGPATTAAADPWASMSMTSLPPAPVPTQGIDVSAAAATANGYHSSMSNLPPGGPMASSSIGYGTANTLALAHPPSQTASPWALPTGPTAPPQAYSAPTPVAPAPAASPWVPPPSISTSAQPSPYYNGTGVPLAVTPQAQPTPSTIGFLSPPSDFGGFADTPAPGHPNSAPPATSADPALFTMSALSNGGYPSSDQANPNAAEAGGSAADQAYAKLVNMDTFSLVSKTDAPRSNPFEFSSSMSNTIGGNRSLADIQSKKASSGPAKPVMNSPVPAPGAMVVSASQNGSYASSYGMQVPQAMMPPQSSQAYGMGVGQQPQMSYGMQPPPPVSQTSYGMPPYQQPPAQAQPPYGGGYYGAAPQQQQPGAGYY